MNVRHELIIHGLCPVNGNFDTYEVMIETSTIVKAEDILAAVKGLPQPSLQEDITQGLAAALGCRVTTIGYHSGVKTTCSA